MNIKKEFTCEECGKYFSDKSPLNKHFRQYHKIGNHESKCEVCEKTFKNDYIMKNHMGKVHSPVNCNICGTNVSMGSFNRHTKTHQDDKFECEQCDKIFSRKEALQKHKLSCGMEKVKVRPISVFEFKCETCEKKFTKLSYLKQHQRTHFTRETIQTYDCKHCEKKFTSNQNLSKHVTKKHPDPTRPGEVGIDSNQTKQKKVYKCEHCNYVSEQNSNLRRHVETHFSNKLKTGRPKKSPSEWSAVTKRIYAKRSLDEFMTRLKENHLEDRVKKLLKRDMEQKKPDFCKITSK